MVIIFTVIVIIFLPFFRVNVVILRVRDDVSSIIIVFLHFRAIEDEVVIVSEV